MKQAFNYLSFVFLLIVCGVAGVEVYQKSLELSEKQPPKPERKPLAVEVTHLVRQTIGERVELVGTLDAAIESQVRARTAGYIKKIPFEVGDFVNQGELVVELDDSKSQQAVSSAKAALKVAQAQRTSSETRKKQLEGKLRSYEDLLKKNVLTRQQWDDFNSDLKVSIADYELNQALVEQAESQLETSRLNLNETKIHSAVSGYVADRFAEVGDLADPNTPILSLVDLAKIRTIVHVVEKNYGKAKIGQTSEITVDAFPGKTFIGEVIRIAPRIDIETRTAAIEIEIDNPEAYLKPGMYARVSLEFSRHKNANVIPMATLQAEGEERFVFVVNSPDDTIERRKVSVGIEDGQNVEIRSGLSPKDRIVALGSRLIKEGDRVSVMKSPPSRSAPPTAKSSGVDEQSGLSSRKETTAASAAD